MQVTHLFTVRIGLIELKSFKLLIRQGQFEPVTEFDQIGLLQLLLLMRGHLALTGGTHAETFLRLRQNHSRATAMIRCCMIGRVDLTQVMAAAL